MNKRKLLISLIVLMIVSFSLSVGLTVAKYISTLKGEQITITIDGRKYLSKEITDQDIYAYTVENDKMTVASTYFDSNNNVWCVVVGIKEDGFKNFSKRKSITTLEFTENKYLTKIGANAFYDWTGLDTFPIPASITEFNPSKNMSALTAYSVDEQNTNYCSIDGVLYSKDGTHLIRYPMNKTENGNFFIVPPHTTTNTVTTRAVTNNAVANNIVTKIDSGAFDNNAHLNAIIVTDNVPYMEEANWGARKETIVIVNRLGVEITSVSYDTSSANHTILLNDTTVVKTEITQTGKDGTLFEGVKEDSSSSEQITLESKDNKWLVLERSETYAYAVLDSDYNLHIYNNSNLIPVVGAEFGNGLTVKGVYKTPSNIPGTRHLEEITDDWTVLEKTASEISNYSWLIYDITNVIVEDEIAPSTLTKWFSNFRGCTSFDLKKMDTSRVTAMDNMFNTCWATESLDVTHFETEHVTTMAGMFSNCNKLTTLDLSSFSNENLTSINGMLAASNLVTVHVGDKWLPKTTMSGNPFSSTSLSGSKGTTFATGANTSTYARVDYDEGLPGYLTYKGEPLVRMAINGVEITSVVEKNGGGAVITFSEKPADMIRLVSSLSGISDKYIAVQDSNGVSQIEIPDAYYKDNQLVSICNVGIMLFACLDNDGTLSVYLREIGIDNDTNTISFAEGETEKVYSLDKVFSTSITVDGVQNIGQPLWTNASADIKKLVIVDEVTPKNTASSIFAKLTACVEFDLKNLDVSNVTNMSYMFHDCAALTNIQWADDINTSNLTNMSAMFYGCTAMTGNLLSENFNMTKVTTVEKLYYGCTSIETLTMHDSFDTSNVITMQDMFYKCTSLTDIVWSKKFDTSKVSRLDSMFAYCENIETLTLPTTFNTENATTMGTMFGFCTKLKNLDFAAGVFNTSKVTALGGIFRACKALTEDDLYEIFSHFTETTSLTNIGAIFNDCDGLTNFVWPEVLNTEKVTYMRETFQGCDNLVKVDLANMNTFKTTNTQQFFNGCGKLTTIIVDDSWNMDIVTDYANMFSGCNNLVGGNGTTFTDMRKIDQPGSVTVKYAIIDGVNGQPGYLTAVEHEHKGETTWVSNGDGTHSHVCTEYGERYGYEAHTYDENHICTLCGHECTHIMFSVYTSKTNTEHIGTCKFCGATEVTKAHTYVGNKCSICEYYCNHNVSVWTPVDDKNHSGTCTICQSTISKEHEYDENGKCTVCSQ